MVDYHVTVPTKGIKFWCRHGEWEFDNTQKRSNWVRKSHRPMPHAHLTQCRETLGSHTSTRCNLLVCDDHWASHEQNHTMDKLGGN